MTIPLAETLIAIDFETTGLDPRRASIIEIGAVMFVEDGEVIDFFEALANPGTPIPADARAIHGITDSDVKDCASPSEVWETFLEWSQGSRILVAHHAAFEAKFIKSLYDGKQLPELHFLDTLEISRNRLRERSSHKLADLVSAFDGPRHRALPDAKACHQLYMRLARTYKTGRVPKKTYLKTLADFESFDRATAKQLNYIRNLGGEQSRAQTKEQASTYITQLKSLKHESSTTQLQSPPITAKLKNPQNLRKEDSVVIAILLLVLFLVIFRTILAFTISRGNARFTMTRLSNSPRQGKAGPDHQAAR